MIRVQGRERKRRGEINSGWMGLDEVTKKKKIGIKMESFDVTMKVDKLYQVTLTFMDKKASKV